MNILATKNFNQQFSPESLAQYQLFRDKMFHPKSDSPLLDENLELLRSKYSSLDMAMIKAIFSDDLHKDVIAISKIDVKSTFHILYEVQVKGKTYVLKINISEDYRDFTFFFEQYMQHRLQEESLSSVPIQFDISRKRYPFDYMIMPYIEWNNLNYCIGKNKEIYTNLGEYFKRIHEIKVEDGAGVISLLDLASNKLRGSFSTWEDFFALNFGKHINKVSEIGIMQNNEKKYIMDFCKAYWGEIKTDKLSLLHNDPSPRNIKTDGHKIRAILDWEDMIIGDPTWEVAFINTFNYGKKYQENFMYFCEGYGIQIDELYKLPKYWMYYLRIVLLKTISKATEKEYNPTLDKARLTDVISHLKKLQ